jgi:hypothetical protein
MLSLPPGAILFLAILQCGLRLCHRYSHYIHAESPQQLSIIKGPLVEWDDGKHSADPTECGNTLTSILARQADTNPLLKEYKTVLEISTGQKLHTPAVPILPQDTIPDVVQSAQARHPTATLDAMAVANPLCTIIDLDAQQPHHERQQRTTYLAGETERRGAAHRRLLQAQPDGTTAVPSLTIESALFPILFPQGKHFFSGKGGVKLGSYLEQQMMAMFSPWTLIKEYPLLMYQVSIECNGSHDELFNHAAWLLLSCFLQFLRP